ncbi:MAG TPA: hypothetical protein VFA04_12985 [Bryobacteraceae bacterium]|nr:hypothetical protein [Bryobacteraceae bacterium]
MLVCGAIHVEEDDLLHALHTPVAGHHVIDEEVLQSGGGLKLFDEFGVDALEFGGVLKGEDDGTGSSTVFHGVLRGRGLARIGAGAGGRLCVLPVGGDLCCGAHQLLLSIHSLISRGVENELSGGRKRG